MEEKSDERKKPVMPFFKSEIEPNPAFNMEMKLANRIFEGSSETAKEFYLKDIERIRMSMEINQREGMIPGSIKKTRKI
jgi:hypothetical protein